MEIAWTEKEIPKVANERYNERRLRIIQNAKILLASHDYVVVRIARFKKRNPLL